MVLIFEPMFTPGQRVCLNCDECSSRLTYYIYSCKASIWSPSWRSYYRNIDFLVVHYWIYFISHDLKVTGNEISILITSLLFNCTLGIAKPVTIWVNRRRNLLPVRQCGVSWSKTWGQVICLKSSEGIGWEQEKRSEGVNRKNSS